MSTVRTIRVFIASPGDLALERRAFQDRHESTQATIEFMRPRAVELARVLKKTGSFYYHCDWHASHYVKIMLDQIRWWRSNAPDTMSRRET